MKATTAQVRIYAVALAVSTEGAGVEAGSQPLTMASSLLSARSVSLVHEGILTSSVYPLAVYTVGNV